MAIREESETSGVTDTDQWSSGSLHTQQQETFTLMCACSMLMHTYMQLYTSLHNCGFSFDPNILDFEDFLVDIQKVFLYE